MRDAGREVSLYRDPLPQASSAALASMLLGRLTSPSNAAIRAEQLLQVQEAINSLDPIDREVVALRHFEDLTRAETAVVLGHFRGGRSQALHPGAQEAQDDHGRDAGRPRRNLNDVDARIRNSMTCSINWQRNSPPGSGAASARAQGIHRPLPGSGRGDPRALPGAGQGRAGQRLAAG